MRAGLQVVVFGEQASQGGPQSEGTEHPAGDVLHIGLFHLLIRPEGQIHALGVGDRDQLGLAFYRSTHQTECRIRPAVECLRLAVETDPLADQRVQASGGPRPAAAAAAGRRSAGMPTCRRRSPAPARESPRRRSTFFFRSCRQPNTASARSESSQAASRMSRLSSRRRSADPNALPRFDGVAALADRFFDVRLKLFVDLAAQPIAANHVRDARPQRHVTPSLRDRRYSDFLVYRRQHGGRVRKRRAPSARGQAGRPTLPIPGRPASWPGCRPR